MLLRPHLWCALSEIPGGAEPGENLFTCCGSVVGHGDCVLCTGTLQTHSPLVVQVEEF